MQSHDSLKCIVNSHQLQSPMWTFGMSYRLFLHNSIEQHHYAKPRLGNARSRAMQAIEMARRAWSLANRQRSLLVLHGSAAARTHWPRDLRGSMGAASAALVPRSPWLSGGADSLAPRPPWLDGCGLGSARSSSSMAWRRHGLTGSAASAARRVRPQQCLLLVLHGSPALLLISERTLPNPSSKQGCGPTALGLGFFKRHPRACRQM